MNHSRLSYETLNVLMKKRERVINMYKYHGEKLSGWLEGCKQIGVEGGEVIRYCIDGTVVEVMSAGAGSLSV